MSRDVVAAGCQVLTFKKNFKPSLNLATTSSVRKYYTAAVQFSFQNSKNNSSDCIYSDTFIM